MQVKIKAGNTAHHGDEQNSPHHFGLFLSETCHGLLRLRNLCFCGGVSAPDYRLQIAGWCSLDGRHECKNCVLAALIEINHLHHGHLGHFQTFHQRQFNKDSGLAKQHVITWFIGPII